MYSPCFVALASAVLLASAACGGEDFSSHEGRGGEAAQGPAGSGGRGGGETVGDCEGPADCADKPGTSCVEGKCTCPSSAPDFCSPDGCVDTSSSVEHCGRCSAPCDYGGSHGDSVCVDGGCSLSCEQGWLDCSTAFIGCETSANDPTSCGGCMVTCALGKCDAGVCDDPVELSAGNDFSCARRAGGSVWCWGANNFGQVGAGSGQQFHTVPVVVPLPAKATALSSRGTSSCALLEDGSVRCWGNTNNAKMTVGVTGLVDPVKVSAGGTSSSTGKSCAVQATGGVKCWQVGFSDGAALQAAIDSKEVAAGGQHWCAIRNSGALECWGENEDGQLGIGNNSDATNPQVVPNVTAEQVVAGAEHTCFATPQGQIGCFGAGLFGQLGNGGYAASPSVVWVAMPSSPDALLAGMRHSGALVGGELWLWGANGYSQVSSETGMNVATPMKYPIGDLKHAALGGNHTCILDDKGNVGCWGAGTLGQLGDGLGEDRTSPTAVEWP